MQLTIDSTEPLDRVLKVVSSLYGVELAVVSTSEQPAREPSAPRTPTARRTQAQRTTKKSAPAAPARKAAAGNGKPTAGNGGSRRSSVSDLGAVRSWARANGFQVSDRGRVSNAVLQAFKEGNRPAS
jgi:nucleoid-associated protein Lsr2